jgi:phage shock protein PspC (stress-responsive transcriptional regulator)
MARFLTLQQKNEFFVSISEKLQVRERRMVMERKRLYKSKDDCMLFGVCGGVAEYFGVDSTIIRLLVAVFCLCLGTGLVAYLISALVIP